MPDNEEQKTMTDEQVAAGDDKDVTDEELASSWEAIVKGESEAAPAETKKEEKPAEKAEPPAEVKPEEKPKQEKVAADSEETEPKDPIERTKFGRLLKAQEERIKQLEAMLVSTGKTVPSEVQPATESDEEEEDRYVTAKDIPTFFKKIEDADQKYQNAYTAEIAKYAKDMDEETFSEVWDEMYKNYNIRRGNKYEPKEWNPASDAQLNWLNAKARVFEGKAKQIKPAVKGGGDDTATGITATQRQEPARKAAPQLDDAALSVLKGSGLTDDEIKDALTGNATYFVTQRRM